MIEVDKKYAHFSMCNKKKKNYGWIANTPRAQLKKRKNPQYFFRILLELYWQSIFKSYRIQSIFFLFIFSWHFDKKYSIRIYVINTIIIVFFF